MPAVRWNCLESGCFNFKLRPKIEVFDDCFPGRIAFGDVDALVEIGGIFCLLEWKSDGGSLQRAQAIASAQFTRMAEGNIVFVVEGNAKMMSVKRYCIFWAGKQQEWVAADLLSVKQRIQGWAAYAGQRRSFRVVS